MSYASTSGVCYGGCRCCSDANTGSDGVLASGIQQYGVVATSEITCWLLRELRYDGLIYVTEEGRGYRAMTYGASHTLFADMLRRRARH